jgi:hypothetical protein
MSEMRGNLPSAGEVSHLLARDIVALVKHIFPNARRVGSEMEVHDLSGAKGDNLRIHVGSGSRRGVWKDFAGGQSGDALELVTLASFGGDRKAGYRWALQWLGLDRAHPAQIEQVRRQAERRAAHQAREEQAAIEKKRKRARAIWLNAKPLQRGDMVDRYLLSRGIDLAQLGRAPGAIRFEPRLQYWLPGNRPTLLATLPGMVCKVSVPGEREFGAIHRTWLKPDGSGKAGINEIGADEAGNPRKAKLVYGPSRGGHLKLWMGEHGGPLATFGGTRLYVSEGIEDGLTAACADPSSAVVACISVGNLSPMILPDSVREVAMLVQNDAPDSQAAQAVVRAQEKWRGEGRVPLEVKVPGTVKDINDLARAALGSRGLARA